mmetsp:Transcript_35594/g.62459  ORF Transcript_35594/g.62459 Transcript_35594/m.62459 type:complete len:178 (+) Transcript_35594:229-762(+)
MEDQQWEFWDWDCADHETASTDDGDHLYQLELSALELPLQHEPISNLSSFLAEEEDSKHLFAASMFRSSHDSDKHLHFDDLSVDSDRTVRVGNKKMGRDHPNESGKPGKIDSSGEKAMFMSAPNESGNPTNIASAGEKAISEKHEFIKQKFSPSDTRYGQFYGKGAVVQGNGVARAA